MLSTLLKAILRYAGLDCPSLKLAPGEHTGGPQPPIQEKAPVDASAPMNHPHGAYGAYVNLTLLAPGEEGGACINGQPVKIVGGTLTVADEPAPAPITSLLGHGWTATWQVRLKDDLSAAVRCLSMSNGRAEHTIAITNSPEPWDRSPN